MAHTNLRQVKKREEQVGEVGIRDGSKSPFMEDFLRCWI